MSFPVLRVLAIVAALLVGLSTNVSVAGAHDTHDEHIPTDTGRRFVTRAVDPTPPPITFPVEGSVTYTDSFGACRGSGCSRSHEGNDLMGVKLQRLLAANDATVTWVRDTATPDGSRSNILILEDAAGWEYWYIHINNDSPGTDDGANPAEWRFAPGIERGSKVKAGQHIAYMGDSGNAEWTAPHVHFEIREPGGTAVDPYDSLRNARHFVLGDSQPPIIADIDDDPAAEILIYNPGDTADHRYDATGATGVFDRGAIQVRGTYDPLVGDFDDNGYDDIIWYAPGSAGDYIWWYGPDGYTSTPTRISGTYEPLVGDFDQNGYDDILWYAPGSATDYLWWYDADGRRSQPTRITGTYTPLVGDFDDNGYEDIFWYAPGAAQDYLWSYHADGYHDQMRTVNGTYAPVVGDVDGDGDADIYWYSTGSAGDYLWRHGPDQTYVSTREDQESDMRVGAGDLDADGRDDLVWFGPSGDEPVEVWNFDGARFQATDAVVNG